jgi:hypothetical protein
MGTYQLTYSFDIVRRVGWSEDDLGLHVDAVLDRLHQADGVTAVAVEADLDSGRAEFSMVLSTSDDDPQHLASALLGVAIRSSGGGYVGLLSLGEEAVVRLGRNQWSGLRTPMWMFRQSDVEQASPI